MGPSKNQVHTHWPGPKQIGDMYTNNFIMTFVGSIYLEPVQNL